MGKRISELTAVAAAAGYLLEMSRPHPTATITASTISAQASDNSYNDSGSGFVAAGFAVGMSVKVAGFTGDVANNITTGRITALTTGKMTIGGTDGDVIVDDAAGESVTITAYESVAGTAQSIADLAATSGPSVASRYTLDLASQADGDPGAGKLRFNHATPASATKIFLDDETSDGVDLSTALLDLGSSGYIRIQSVDDVGEWLVAKWTAIVDDTGYFDIAITVLASKGTLDDTDDVLVTFDAKGSGGGDGVVVPFAHGNTGATETFDFADGPYHTATLDDDCVFTFTGATAAQVDRMVLEITNDGTGGYAITWPGSVEWVRSGVAPTIDDSAGAINVFEFITTDGGTVWLGFFSGNGIDGEDGAPGADGVDGVDGAGVDPWMVDINVFATPAANTNWNALSGNDSTWLFGYLLQSSGAQNAEASWPVSLSAGTWTIEFMSRKSTNIGIYTVSIDGVSVGTVDGYAASPASNQRSSITGIAVTPSGVKTLNFKMATKNASSSSYFGNLAYIRLLRTA
jgi:hypothetical protein